MSPQSLFSLIDFLGVAAAAIGGALEARKDKIHKYDFVGVIGLGLVSALGGGIVRDVLIAHGAPLALTDLRYLIVAFSGCFLGLLLGSRLHSPTQSLIIPIDAAALGLFRAGKRWDYEYEQFAQDVVLRIVRRYLADKRALLQDDEECQRALREILETFIEAGWPAAQHLPYRIDEIHR
jgi:uncharacterized membrane protein YeiH